jgi:hypothetical protein
MFIDVDFRHKLYAGAKSCGRRFNVVYPAACNEDAVETALRDRLHVSVSIFETGQHGRCQAGSGNAEQVRR